MIVCEACGAAHQWTIIDAYKDRKTKSYKICSNCHLALVTCCLSKKQFFNLIKAGHNTNEFYLHEDFYDEKGNALQPHKMMLMSNCSEWNDEVDSSGWSEEDEIKWKKVYAPSKKDNLKDYQIKAYIEISVKAKDEKEAEVNARDKLDRIYEIEKRKIIEITKK